MKPVAYVGDRLVQIDGRRQQGLVDDLDRSPVEGEVGFAVIAHFAYSRVRSRRRFTRSAGVCLGCPADFYRRPGKCQGRGRGFESLWPLQSFQHHDSIRPRPGRHGTSEPGLTSSVGEITTY